MSLNTISRSTWLFFLGSMFLISLAYFSTLSEFLTPGDSGELIAVSASWAVLHPPGYPLYEVFAGLFSKLPWGTLAWRVSLFSLVCQLLAGAFTFCFLKEWLKKNWISASVTLIYCFSSFIWRYGTEAEVFALNNLFGSLLIYFGFQLFKNPSRTWLLRSSFVLGLAASHHPTLLLFAGPLFGILFWQNQSLFKRFSVLLMTLTCFLLGLLPFGFLFIFGQSHQLISWGDLSSWKGFLTHVLRQEYGTFRLAISSETNPAFVTKLYIFAREISSQFFWIGLIPFVAAIMHIKENRFSQLLLISLASYLGIFITLTNLPIEHLLYVEVQSRFWILPYLVICLMAAGGLHFFSNQHPRIELSLKVVLLFVIAAQLKWNGQFDRTDLFEKIAHSILDHTEKDTVLFCREDIYCNGLRYLQVAQNVRPDVRVVPQDLLWWPWMKENLEKNIPGIQIPGLVLRYTDISEGQYDFRTFLKANLGKFPISASELGPEQLKILQKDFMIFPVGFVSTVKSLEVSLSLDQVLADAKDFLNLKLPSEKEFKRGSWENYVIRSYYEFLIYFAHDIFKNAQGRTDWILAGIDQLHRLELESDDYKIQAIKEQGLLYGQLTQKDEKFRPLALSYLNQYLDFQSSSGKAENPEIMFIQQVREKLESASPKKH